MVPKLFLLLSSRPAMLAAAVLAQSDNKDEQEKKSLVRARELSIYSNPPQKSESKENGTETESTLLLVVREVRQSLWEVTDQMSQVSNKMSDVVDTGKAHMSSTIQILRDEENYMQRYGAIAAGGLVGYVIALRRGWFRRIIYSATGATAVAAVCYPEEAKAYSSEGFQEAKHYIAVAYHFVNGVLRDYVGVQLPSLPGPLTINNSSAADKDSSTVPTSATLMPPPSSGPSHISAGPIPLPPLDNLSSVSDPQKKQGTNLKNTSFVFDKDPEEPQITEPEPKPTSSPVQDPVSIGVDHYDDYQLYSRRY